MADGSYQLAISIPVDVSQVGRATSAVVDLGTAGRAATEASHDLATAQAATTQATAGMDRASRSANAGLVNLVRQMSDVGVMATLGASPLQILATQGEQIAFAAKEAGPALLRLAPAISAVAIAAAAGAAAWAVYANATYDEDEAQALSDGLRDVAAQMDRVGARTKGAAEAWRSFGNLATEANEKWLVATGQSTQADVDARHERERLRDVAREQLVADGQRIAVLRQAQAEADRVAQAEAASAEAKAAAFAQARRLDGAIADATATLEAHKAEVKNAERDVLAYARAVKAADAAEEAKSERDRKAAEMQRLVNDERRKAAAAASAARAADEALLSIAMRGMTPLERAAAEYRRLRQEISAYVAAGGSAETAAQALTVAMKEYADAVDAASSSTANLRSAEDSRNALGTTANSLSGPNAVMQGVASAGPWGAIIAAIIELVRDFKDVGDQFNDFTISLNESISKLPETLGENLGRWLETGTEATLKMFPEFIASLLSSIDDIMGSMTDALAAVFFDEDNWTSVGEAIAQGLLDFIMGSFGTDEGGVSFWSVLDGLLLGGLGENIGGMFSGTKASGGYIAEPGMYRLHQGEVVYNASQVQTDAKQSSAASRRGRMFGQAGRLYIEVDADSMADTMSGLSARGYSFAAEGA